jgi:simple sugar transport system substrate-binding protein
MRYPMKKRSLTITSFAALLATGAMLTACSSSTSGTGSSATGGSTGSSTGSSTSTAGVTSSSGSSLTIDMVTHASPGDSFWTVVQNGAEAGAAAMGVKLNYAASGGNVQKQAQLITSAAAGKPAAIITTLADPTAFTPPIKAAEAAGVPVFTINSGTSVYTSTGSLGHVGEDASVAGVGVGKKFDTLSVKHVLCIIQERGNTDLENYCAGLKSAFSGQYSSMYVNGTTDLTGTQQEIQAELASNPSIDAVFSLDAPIAPLVVAAAAAINRKVTVGTWTLSPQVLTDIESGQIAFAEDQQPYLQGYLSVVIATEYAKDGIRPSSAVLTGPNFVTKANAAQVVALSAKGMR